MEFLYPEDGLTDRKVCVTIVICHSGEKATKDPEMLRRLLPKNVESLRSCAMHPELEELESILSPEKEACMAVLRKVIVAHLPALF